MLARAVTPQLGSRMRARWSSRVGGGICSGWRTWRAPLRRPFAVPLSPAAGAATFWAMPGLALAAVMLCSRPTLSPMLISEFSLVAQRPARRPTQDMAWVTSAISVWHRGRPGRRRGGHRRRRRPLRGYAGGAAALPSLWHVYNKRPLKHRRCDQKGPAPCRPTRAHARLKSVSSHPVPDVPQRVK